MDGAPQRPGGLLGTSSGRHTGMMPSPEDEIAALLRSACGGDADVEMTDNGMNVWVRPASGGSVFARLADANSPVLAALLGVFQVRVNTD